MDSEPVIRATPCLKGATPSGHPLSHPHQAMSCLVGALDARDAGTATVVEYFQGDVMGVVADGDVSGRGRAAVFKNISEGFLDDAVAGELGALGQRLVTLRAAFECQGDGEGPRHLRDEAGDVVKALSGGQLRGGVIVTQHTDETSSLVEGVTGRRSDRVEGLPTGRESGLDVPGLFMVSQVGATICLHHDDRQGVGDNIVHVAGDLGPLLLGGQPDALVSLAFQICLLYTSDAADE